MSEIKLDKDDFVYHYVNSELSQKNRMMYYKSKARTEKILSDLFGCKKRMLMMYGIDTDFFAPHALVDEIELAFDWAIFISLNG